MSIHSGSKMEGYSFNGLYILFRLSVTYTGRVGWDTLYIIYYNKIFQLPNLYLKRLFCFQTDKFS